MYLVIYSFIQSLFREVSDIIVLIDKTLENLLVQLVYLISYLFTMSFTQSLFREVSSIIVLIGKAVENLLEGLTVGVQET